MIQISGGNMLERMASALSDLIDEFQSHPTFFFTEHDLASRCYHLLQQYLDYQTVTGKDGNQFYLVHHEYPTPFRCDMSNGKFEVKDTHYKRGHYDIVVFNPRFLQECSYELAKGQNYKLFEQDAPQVLASIQEPAILLGIELMFNRDPLSVDKEQKWFKSIDQDYRKLKASIKWGQQNFMTDYRVIAFNRMPNRGEDGFFARFQPAYSEKIIFCHPNQRVGGVL